MTLFFFKCSLGFARSFVFLYEFYNVFVSFYRNAEILTGIALNMQVFGEGLMDKD